MQPLFMIDYDDQDSEEVELWEVEQMRLAERQQVQHQAAAALQKSWILDNSLRSGHQTSPKRKSAKKQKCSDALQSSAEKVIPVS